MNNNVYRVPGKKIGDFFFVMKWCTAADLASSKTNLFEVGFYEFSQHHFFTLLACYSKISRPVFSFNFSKSKSHQDYTVNVTVSLVVVLFKSALKGYLQHSKQLVNLCTHCTKRPSMSDPIKEQ